MPAVVTLRCEIRSDPETRRRVHDAVARVMSRMASDRVWKLKRTSAGRAPEFALRGFEEGCNDDTLTAKKVLEGLDVDDLRAIKARIEEFLHGDEHG
jgi:hypothetical protein